MKLNKQLTFNIKIFDIMNKNQLKLYIDWLCHTKPQNYKQAKKWFYLFNKISIFMQEKQAKLEYNFMKDINNTENENQLQYFEKEILAFILEKRQQITNIYISSKFKYAMHADDKEKITIDLQKKINFMSTNLSNLQIKEAYIIREYKKFMTNTETYFFNKQTKISVIANKLYDYDEKIRKEAFLSYWGHIYENEDYLQQLFSDLLNIRLEQATISQSNNYTQFAFSELNRFDYNEQDCYLLHSHILTEVVPLLTTISKTQCQSLNTETLKPWNITILPTIIPQHQPFNANLEKQLQYLISASTHIHKNIANFAKNMLRKQRFDIFPAPNKMPGAFCLNYQQSKSSIIFANLGGNLKDFISLFHEFGHSFHAHAYMNIDNILLRNPPLEFCETIAIFFELLYIDKLNLFLKNSQISKNNQQFHLFNILTFWPFMSMIDLWQQNIYKQNSFVTPQHRNNIWQNLSKQYRPHVDWRNFEHYETIGWFSRPHIFTNPFYFIDYGIAEIYAILLYDKYLINPDLCINNLIKAMSLGGQRNLKELYNICEINFDFSIHNINKCINIISKFLSIA